MKHKIIKELLNFMDKSQELDSGICDEISGNAIVDYTIQKKKLVKDTADRIMDLFKNYISKLKIEKQNKSELEDVEDSIQKYKNDLKNEKGKEIK